jgi:ATP-binding cassette subfamily G (WHITE) protein 5 (sterolin 1)
MPGKHVWIWMQVERNCISQIISNKPSFSVSISRYINGSHYLKEKYGFERDELSLFLDRWFNFGVCFVFPLGLFIINLILYVIPLPAFVKAKFRE